MSSVRFMPWRGDRYESSPLFGKKVLILGESHYSWDKNKPLDKWHRLTVECVQEQICGICTHAFWTHIAVAFLNRRPSLEDKANFWHSVAFYNYIQRSVGFGPRVRPTQQMWQDSEQAFAEVLNKLKPQSIIVLGYSLWDNLPNLGGAAGPQVVGAKKQDTWRYPYTEGSALAYGIIHPSSGRFSGNYWFPHVMQAISFA